MPSDRSDCLQRLIGAKRGFVTRHVDLDAVHGLAQAAPLASGDLVLARVNRIRQHTRLELCNGRRAHLFEGDELILAAGRRYATDQFVAELPAVGAAHLVASGGIAANVTGRHEAIKPATEIEILAALAGRDARPLNLRDFAPLVARSWPRQVMPRPVSLLVLGTGMNSGKTGMVSAVTRAFKAAGQRVMACKLTGTGSGNDLWQYADAGADTVLDFTDAGLSGTWQESLEALLSVARLFQQAACEAQADYLVVEVADGVLQRETLSLIESDAFRAMFDACLLAASCSASAVHAARVLSSLQSRVIAIGGKLSQSPLYQHEVMAQTGLPVLTNADLARAKILNSHLGLCGVAA